VTGMKRPGLFSKPETYTYLKYVRTRTSGWKAKDKIAPHDTKTNNTSFSNSSKKAGFAHGFHKQQKTLENGKINSKRWKAKNC
jgi:hypothetical protein